MLENTQLNSATDPKKTGYTIRTRFFNKDGEPKYTNHLVTENSPYLLQHAHNPVNWRPWSDETFALAKEQNKPIFLSIGYSTCHWCHVMEEESFDNESIAELLNDNFISIKVDREQRPDLDEIYMTAVQIVSGHGGWPMSTFLTPEGKPFYGGTYFQPHQFRALLTQVDGLWKDKAEEIRDQAEQLAANISKYLSPGLERTTVEDNAVDAVVQQLLAMSDVDGGFGKAPKFPHEPNLLLLLELIERSSKPLFDQEEWKVVKLALDSMLQGGIYDQIAGGFHRYAVDNHWLVPHFEKMLYNQAQLTRVYSRAFKLSKDPEYERIVRETLDYVLREMTTETGVFYSATDADSEGIEGKFFVWSSRELSELFDSDTLDLIRRVYGVTKDGNFEGSNILNLTTSLNDAASDLQLSYPSLLLKLDEVKTTLYQERQKRIPPLTDNKIITEWNGMMIAAFAEAAEIFNETRYREAAVKAADYLWQHQRQPNGKFWRLSLEGIPGEESVLEDYAHYLDALVQVYDLTNAHIWLERAESLVLTMRDNFWDEDEGGFCATTKSTRGPLLVRAKSVGDQATISGNSIIVGLLNKIYRRTGDLQIKALLEDQVRAFSGYVKQFPMSAPIWLKGLIEMKSPNPTYKQYEVSGHMWAQLSLSKAADDMQELSLDISMHEGWHIQSHDIEDEEGHRTHVELLSKTDHELLDVRYPDSSLWQTTSSEEPLPIYSDRCKIEITIKRKTMAPVRIALNFQACNQLECHAPHRIELCLW